MSKREPPYRPHNSRMHALHANTCTKTNTQRKKQRNKENAKERKRDKQREREREREREKSEIESESENENESAREGQGEGEEGAENEQATEVGGWAAGSIPSLAGAWLVLALLTLPHVITHAGGHGNVHGQAGIMTHEWIDIP